MSGSTTFTLNVQFNLTMDSIIITDGHSTTQPPTGIGAPLNSFYELITALGSNSITFTSGDTESAIKPGAPDPTKWQTARQNLAILTLCKAFYETDVARIAGDLGMMPPPVTKS